MLPAEFLLGFLGKTALMSHYGSGFRVAEQEETPNFAITIKIESQLKQFPRAKAVFFKSVSRCQWYTLKTTHGQVLKSECLRKNGNFFFFSPSGQDAAGGKGQKWMYFRGKMFLRNIGDSHVLCTMKQHNWVVTDSGLNFSLNFGKLSFLLWGKHASYLPFPD